MFRVTIGIPSLESWNAEFGFALSRLLIFACRQPLSGKPLDVSIARASGSILPSNRNRLARHAVEGKSDFLLFLDCDMDFPPDTLHRLLVHNRDVVAANYVKRQFPATPLARQGGKAVVSGADKQGLEAVETAATGIMLIRTTVFGRIPPPAFAFEPVPGRPEALMGEDVYFCRKLRAAGIPVLIDHDLSREVAHIGSFHYRMRHAEEEAP